MSQDLAQEPTADGSLRVMLAGARTKVARAVIVATGSSTRRRVGASLVIGEVEDGSLGGGELEAQAAASARALLAKLDADRASWPRALIATAQGPILGQHSAGVMHVLVEAFGPIELDRMRRLLGAAPAHALLARPMQPGIEPIVVAAGGGPGAGPGPEPLGPLLELMESNPETRLALSDRVPDAGSWLIERLAPPRIAFHIHGPGDVAQALLRVLQGTPFTVVMHKPSEELSPQVAREPGAFHAVLTGSHERDVEVCRQLLAANRFGYVGLIGSKLKREGLIARLAQLGIGPEQSARVSCPIGLPEVKGKEPGVIAIAIAAEAIARLRKTVRS